MPRSGVSFIVTIEVHDREVLEQWFGARAAPGWVTALIALASLVSVAVAQIAGTQVVNYLTWADLHDWFFWPSAFGIVLAGALTVAWLPRWRLPRALRVAIVLPPLHVAAILSAWVMWRTLVAHVPTVDGDMPMLHALPIASVVAASAAYTLGIARVIVGRRRSEWLHAAVTFALVHLLLVGIWLPVGAILACKGIHGLLTNDNLYLIVSPHTVAIVLGPPLLAATAITLVAIRRFEAFFAWRRACVGVVVFGLGAAMLVRLEPNTWAQFAYINFIHVLFALVFVATGALIALAVSLRVSRRGAGEALTGVVVDAPEPVAHLHIAGWLRGPRVLANGFSVVTKEGVLSVPPGAEIRVAPPAISMWLKSSQAVEVLRGGERVLVSGFVPPPAGDPFRRAATLVPGPRGIIVTRNPADRGSFGAVSLALWRPCIAYLLVAVAVALPAIAGALAAH